MKWFQAIRRGDTATITNLLLTCIRKQQEDGQTGLMEAIQKQHYDIALTLVRHECGMITETGETALMFLCKMPHPLLTFGPDARSSRTANWVHTHTKPGRTTQVLALLRPLIFSEAGKVTKQGLTAIMLAVNTGNYDATILLASIESGLSYKYGWSETMYLILRGYDDRILFELNLEYKRPDSGITALMLAAFVDNARAARLFFRKEWGLRDKYGRSALMFASIGGHTAIASMLLPREKNIRDSEGRTAIMYASVYGNLDIVKLLAPAEGQSEDMMGWTAIVYSVLSWQNDILDFLVENYYILTQTAMYTALQYAAIIGNDYAIKRLLQKEGRIYTYDGETALILAAKYKQIGKLQQSKDSVIAIQALCAEEATMEDLDKKTALIHAVLSGDNIGVAVLQQFEGGLTDKDGHSALYYALESHNIEAANLLYSKEKQFPIPIDWTNLMVACVGCDTECLSTPSFRPRKQTKMGLTALMVSCIVSFGDGVRALCDLEAGYKDANGQSALMFAIQNRFSVGIESLMNRECRIQDAMGMTALMHLLQDNFGRYALTLASLEAGLIDKTGFCSLMYASKAGIVSVVESLLAAEHAITAPNGRTALMLASQVGHTSCVSLLVDSQGRKQDNHGLTAMMFAAYRGHLSIVEILVNKESQMRDNEGRTALIYAIFGQHAQVIKLLLKVERDISTNKGKTAYEYATASANPNIMALFSEKGSPLSPKEASTPHPEQKNILKGTSTVRSIRASWSKRESSKIKS